VADTAFGEISVPTLIIAGSDDWVAPAQGAERLHAAIPDSDLVVFEDSGHFPFIEEHDRFVSLVAAWLAGGIGHLLADAAPLRNFIRPALNSAAFSS
jgi:pimeloyl-ACP methyl ester carboxylesterase